MNRDQFTTFPTPPNGYVKHERIAFDNWSDFVLYADARDTDVPREHQSSRVMSPTGWNGDVTFEGAIALAHSGWAEGAEKANKIASALFTKLSTLIEREEVVYDFEGAEIDVARYLDGEPEAFMRFEYPMVEGPGRRIFRLVYNCAASSGVTGEAIIRRGATVAALAQCLEYAGHGVEIVVTAPVSGGSMELFEVVVKVKSADQPIDTQRIAFAFAHPAMNRRVMFSVDEGATPSMVRSIGAYDERGYGRPAQATDRGDVYVGSSHIHEDVWRYENDAAMQKWTIEQLQKCGVKIDEEALKDVLAAEPAKPAYQPYPTSPSPNYDYAPRRRRRRRRY